MRRLRSVASCREWWATPLLLTFACAGDGARAVVDGEVWPLVDGSAWQLAEPERDPFVLHRAGRVPCSENAFHEEGAGVEIETLTCNYVTLSQPALVDVPAGSTVAMVVWWQDLRAAGPALGHVALAIGDRAAPGGPLLWEEEIAIPGNADVREVQLESKVAYLAGDPIYAHVRNHGDNTWRFASITLQ